MEFRLLGSFEVWDGERPVAIAGSKRRALLALLVLRANEVVRSERLIEELWGEAPPRNAGAALHSHVSRLRKALGPEVLARHEWGYVLRAAPETIDLCRFEAMLAEAEPLPALERSRKLADALSLWRGPPLADLALEPALAQEIDRLEQLRLTTSERRIDADLESGRSAELVGELEALIAANPLREHLRWQLILALYRSDRQAEALEVYRETRRLLADELGLEPSPALRELERAILRHDPGLGSTATFPLTAADDEPRSRSRRSVLLPGLAILAVLAAGAAAAIALVRSEAGAHRSAQTVVEVKNTTISNTTISTSPAKRHIHNVSHHTQAGATSTRATSQPEAVTTVTVAAPPPTPPTTTTHQRTHPTTATRRQPTKPTTPPEPTKHQRIAPAVTTPPVTISDSFSGSQVDPTTWYVACCSGTGVTVAEQDGHLEYTFAAATTPGGQYAVAGGHIGTQCRFPGDFDARVDFTLTAWPPNNGVVASLFAWLGPTNIGTQVNRVSNAGWGDTYQAWLNPQAPITIRIPDTTGTLRLARSNGVLSAYLLHADHWQLLSSRTTRLTATIAIGANTGSGTGTTFGGQQVIVDFNNFTVKATNPICPQGSTP
jgi:DNA-binding SARP family transcriptional activator